MSLPAASSPLETLVNYLTGAFENKAQAQADPTWYVHLRLWQRRVLQLSDGQTHTLFLEQASVAAGQPPYRQRILQLSNGQLSDRQPNHVAGEAGLLFGKYFALADPLKFRGAGTEASLLEGMSTADLVALPNSESHIRYQSLSNSAPSNGYQFQAALPDGKLCSFDYDGQQRYVYLGFDVAPRAGGIELLTYDKGIDPGTGRGLWGALMGPFCMIKQMSFD
ncbi:MAG: chromophore lyase CpcT/CpeT [Cyanobacteria bacterium P01_F01_bin.53]